MPTGVQHDEANTTLRLIQFLSDSADVDRLDQLASALSEPILRGALTTCLTADEVAALEARVARLRRTRRHPVPTTDWPAIPWPAM